MKYVGTLPSMVLCVVLCMVLTATACTSAKLEPGRGPSSADSQGNFNSALVKGDELLGLQTEYAH